MQLNYSLAVDWGTRRDPRPQPASDGWVKCYWAIFSELYGHEASHNSVTGTHAGLFGPRPSEQNLDDRGSQPEKGVPMHLYLARGDREQLEHAHD